MESKLFPMKTVNIFAVIRISKSKKKEKPVNNVKFHSFTEKL